MRRLVSALLLTASLLGLPGPTASAATTTTYTLPPAVCVHINNCIIYGPGELFSLWTTPTWSIFTVNSYSPQTGYTTLNTFYCHTENYSSGAGQPSGVTISVSCSDVDAHGVPFTMSYTVNAYSYYSRGGGGRGGGGAGTRWQITGGSVTITQ